MFQRYKELTRKPDSPVREPKVLFPFYHRLEDMKDFFVRVSCPTKEEKKHKVSFCFLFFPFDVTVSFSALLSISKSTESIHENNADLLLLS